MLRRVGRRRARPVKRAIISALPAITLVVAGLIPVLLFMRGGEMERRKRYATCSVSSSRAESLLSKTCGAVLKGLPIYGWRNLVMR